MKVDIRQVPPTGPGGRVTRDDVNRFATGQTAPAIAEDERAAVKPETRAVAEAAATAADAIPYLDIEPLPDFEEWGPVEIEPLRSIRLEIAYLVQCKDPKKLTSMMRR